ncbi:hybrid sensor histidine kinase/response regulator transcription factor [Alteromonas sp. 14N.309.X.WAT.G.H12]|uniref:hybrid sensor histidine kinase/response regulator transcription factor n=1 Tax=Alteromonas sp. 14N.309.X.WAT.G.H12 TaxID=3120824 RepID=UPI002FD226BB
MSKRIFSVNKSGYFLFVLKFIVIWNFSACSHASVYWDRANNVFSDTSTGIIRDILLRDDGVWLGAENGVFLIQGDNEKRLTMPSHYDGYISDLETSTDGKVWVTIYGEGIYLVDNSLRLEPIYTGNDFSKSWQTTDFKGKLYILTIGKILVVDKKSGTIIKEIDGFSDRRFSSFPVINIIDDKVFISEGDKFLILGADEINLNEGNVSEFWPKVRTIKYISKVDGKYYVFGDKGVYKSDELFSPGIFYPSVKPIKNVFDVQKIDKNLRIIADGIFEIDSNYLNRVSWSSLLWNQTVSGSITAGQFSSTGNFFLSSSQKGFIFQPNFYDSIKILLPGDSISNSVINGLIRSYEHSDSKIYSQYIYSACLRSIMEKYESIDRLCNTNFHLLESYTNNHWLGFTTSADETKFTVYDEKFDIVDEFLYSVLAKDLTVDGFGQIYLITEDNKILTQLSRYAWRTPKVEFPKNEEVTCFLHLSNKKILLCTESAGLWLFNTANENLNKVSLPGNADIRYIRGAQVDNDGDLWVATNSGLFVSDVNFETIFKVVEADGIKDLDFEYQGFVNVGDKLYIDGDNFDYKIDVQSFKANIKRRLKRVNHVQLVESEALRNVVGDIPLPELKDISWEYGHGPNKIEAFVNDFINRDELRIEYSLTDEPTEWIKTDTSFAAIGLNQLPSGTHTLRLRVHDPRSYQQQPVTLLNIKVLPPWWRSWQALVCYGVLLTVIIFSVYWNYRKRIREQGAYLTALVNEKNRVLEETNDSIKRMLERKQTAFSNLSHELRTPLSLILGPLSQLKKMVTSSKALEHLRLAERNAERIQVLLDQMLEVERLDHVKTLPVTECDIASVTQCILYDLSALAEIKHQSLNWQCTTREKIHLYAGTLEKILMNLVSNAVKYTDESGEINVEVKVENLQLIIQVEDNGIGMTEAERARIFERYTRFNDGENGAGVGLALVKELVTANGGWINVTSEQGRGTCFAVTLPMLNQLQNDAIEEPNLNDYEVGEDVGDKHAVILVVDDNQEMRNYLQSLFANNYTCLLANNGESALTIIEKIRPDLIITDYKMPVMNGLTLANRLRSDSDNPYIPIIMLSAFGDSGSMVKGLQANIDYYLTKPINEETLLLTVTNLLNREETRRSKTNELVEGENDWPLPDFVSEREQQFYFKLMALIEKMYGQENCTRMEVAQRMAMSDRHLQRKVKAMFGKNFTDFLREFRMSKAKDMLEQGKQITQVVYDVGFTSPSYFSRSFKDVYDMTPSEYQKHNYKPQIKSQSNG